MAARSSLSSCHHHAMSVNKALFYRVLTARCWRRHQSTTAASEKINRSNDQIDAINAEMRMKRIEDKSVSIQQRIRHELLALARERGVNVPSSLQEVNGIRPPRSLSSLYLSPMKRRPKDVQNATRVCNLQLRSYFVQNLDFMADFALRTAYYLDLPAVGPVPLPRRTERWTVPRGHFVHKKSQENWERVTRSRLIQVKDGHPDVVKRWLAFLRRWCWYGVGMKADVWEWESMEAAVAAANETELRSAEHGVQWDLIGQNARHGNRIRTVAGWPEGQDFAAEPRPDTNNAK